MTRREREDLAALVRRREKVAKTAAAQRAAELLADFEAQCAARYAYDEDATWRAITEEAQRVVQEADAAIAARCRELGIPPRFRPGLQVSWHGCGENAVAERRAELRAVAKTRIGALEKQARTKVERQSVELQTQLVAGGLASAAARAFLDAMPTPAALMPPLDVRALESATPRRAGRYSLPGASYDEGAADEETDEATVADEVGPLQPPREGEPP
jgi:hypothetical protein